MNEIAADAGLGIHGIPKKTEATLGEIVEESVVVKAASEGEAARAGRHGGRFGRGSEEAAAVQGKVFRAHDPPHGAAGAFVRALSSWLS